VTDAEVSPVEAPSSRRPRVRLAAGARRPFITFLVVALLSGLGFTFLVPPFQVPDEPNHFYRVVELSEGHLRPAVVDGQAGVMTPQAVLDFARLDSADNIGLNPGVGFDYRAKTAAAWDLRASGNSRVGVSDINVATYPPVVYAPSALGIAIARVFTDRVVVWFYVGRLASLLAFVALVAAAIAIAPRARWAIAAVGLLPMSVYLAGAISADGMTIGVAALFGALVSRAYWSSRLSRGLWVGLLVAAFLLALVKPGYSLFGLLGLTLSAKAWREERTFRSLVPGAVVTAVAGLTAVAWQLYARTIPADLTVMARIGGVKTDPSAQLGVVLHHPLTFLRVLTHTFTGSEGLSILNTFVGYFGWITIQIPLLAGLAVVVGLVIAHSRDRGQRRVPWFDIAIGLVALMGFVGFVSVGMWLYWSSVGDSVVHGWQGRYFLPVLAAMAPLFASRYRLSVRPWLSVPFLVVGLLGSLYAIVSIFT